MAGLGRSILILGAGGQLGRAAMRLAAGHGFTTRGYTRDELDILDGKALAEAVQRVQPAAVFNAAAYTAVDRAEEERERAFAINAEAPAAVAGLCADHGIPLVHFSTDYVFAGTGNAPLRESDPTGPINVYGESKLAGERAVRERLPRHLILRTSAVFSPSGHNFVASILRAADQHSELKVVADQMTRPTCADDLATAALAALDRTLETGRDWGTYHYAGDPATSWYEFARAILAARKRLTGEAPPRLIPIPGSEWPAPAPRPACSVLDCSLFQATFGVAPARWAGAVEQAIRGS
jgi:dTDP-4-dehydrorhamnose reductase